MAVVKGKQTTFVNVDISNEEILKAAEDLTASEIHTLLTKLIKRKLNLPEDSFMKDNDWEVEYERYGGSHSWFNTETIRSITEEDTKVLESVSNIYEVLKGE